MGTPADTIRKRLNALDFRALFVEDLGVSGCPSEERGGKGGKNEYQSVRGTGHG